MIGSVRGTVIERTATGEVLVEVGGVGYRAFVPASALPVLHPGDNAFLFTHLHVREDAMVLYGFPTRDERDTFEALIGTTGVGPKLALAREVMKALAGGLRDGRDEIGLFTFSSELEVEQPFTLHAAQLEDAVDLAQPFGTTSLYDAIAQTARQLALRDAPRRAILVVTDGLDNSSQMAPSEVSALASSIDVPVYVIVAVPPIDHAQFLQRDPRTAQPTGDLRDLAWWTGGDLLWVDAAKDAAVRVSEVLSELRHQYLIAIESSDASEWRPLDLRVRRRNLTVRARSGYFGREAGSK